MLDVDIHTLPDIHAVSIKYYTLLLSNLIKSKMSLMVTDTIIFCASENEKHICQLIYDTALIIRCILISTLKYGENTKID